MNNVEWRKGLPSHSGYYLITWDSPLLETHLVVSEAWFNPDAIEPWWWSRAYTGEPHRTGMSAAIKWKVLAWAEMPRPYGANEEKS